MENCLDCSSKSCKTNGADCFGLKESSCQVYDKPVTRELIKNSSMLVDNGRAGQLSRFDEVIEFCQLQGYQQIGLAYCFGLEPVAETVRKRMNQAGLNIVPARCTMGGVKECDIDLTKTSEAISCNPAGQAEFLNQRADFVIELGLCLGHDIVFHQELKIPFTVLLVKDRVHSHNPLKGITL